MSGLWCDRRIAHRTGSVGGDGFVLIEGIEVPHEWLDDTFPDHNGDYETLAGGIGENGYYVWECYLAGLDPHDKGSVFYAKIKIENGEPIIEPVPDLREKPDLDRERIYTVEAKEKLTDEKWLKYPSEIDEDARFFRVKVGLP